MRTRISLSPSFVDEDVVFPNMPMMQLLRTTQYVLLGVMTAGQG